ncbi:MAG: hypothetical protein EKK64_00905 [Neisseriaceae bacterium]|nr:MAG: hypothetical protein EKK64_00905 [Neisseriaceae bacterium]
MTSYEHDPMYLLKLKNIQSCINSASEFIDQIIKYPEVNIDPKFSNLRSLLQDANLLVDNFSANLDKNKSNLPLAEDSKFLGIDDKKGSCWCPNCGDSVLLNSVDDKHRCWNCGCQFKIF